MSMATGTDTREQVGCDPPGGDSMISLPAEQVALLDRPLPTVLTTEMPDGRLQSTVVWCNAARRQLPRGVPEDAAVRAPSLQRCRPRGRIHQGPTHRPGGVLGGIRASLLSPEFE